MSYLGPGKVWVLTDKTKWKDPLSDVNEDIKVLALWERPDLAEQWVALDLKKVVALPEGFVKASGEYKSGAHDPFTTKIWVDDSRTTKLSTSKGGDFGPAAVLAVVVIAVLGAAIKSRSKR